jgi:hypothetical protein
LLRFRDLTSLFQFFFIKEELHERKIH